MVTYVLGVHLLHKRGHRNGLDHNLPNWQAQHPSTPAAFCPCQT
jgi:hypothetical protein